MKGAVLFWAGGAAGAAVVVAVIVAQMVAMRSGFYDVAPLSGAGSNGVRRLDAMPLFSAIHLKEGGLFDRPFVVRVASTQADMWRASSSWTAEKIQSEWNLVFSGGGVSDHPAFSYYNSKRSLHGWMASKGWNAPYQKADLMTSNLFVDDESYPWAFRYVAGAVGGPLLHDLEPFDAFIVPLVRDDGTVTRLPKSKSPKPTFFLSSPNVVVPSHYDDGYNFLVQIDGKKSITLHPPEEALKTYPSCHPQSRQTTNASIAAGKTPEGGERVTLHPGEVLYIPPMWMHHIAVSGNSVSVSVMTDAATLPRGGASGYHALKKCLEISSPAAEKLTMICALLGKSEWRAYLKNRWSWTKQFAPTISSAELDTAPCCEAAASPWTNRIDDIFASKVQKNMQKLLQYRLIDGIIENAFASGDDLIAYVASRARRCGVAF